MIKPSFYRKGNNDCACIFIINMLHIKDGNLVTDSLLRSNICYLTSLKHLIRSRAVTNRFFLRKDLFSCVTMIIMHVYSTVKILNFRTKRMDQNDLNDIDSLFDFRPNSRNEKGSQSISNFDFLVCMSKM